MNRAFLSDISHCVLSLLLAVIATVRAYEEYTFEGYGFYFYQDSYQDSTGCHERDGIWRVDLATGEEEQIFGDNSGRYLISSCALSYHGKQLLFHGASIGNGVINNDGTGYEKLSSKLLLTMVNEPPHWSRLGVFRVTQGELRRYDISAGDYSVVPFPIVPGWDDGTFKGGGNIPCYASGDGTRLWNRGALYKNISFGPKQYDYPTFGGHANSHSFFRLSEDGSPKRMFGRNFWGHGDVITLDGEYVYCQDFGHEGWWIVRQADGQKVADQQRTNLPFPAPDFHTACGERDVVQDGRRPMLHCTNDNDWFYFFTSPRFFGLPDESIDHDCFFNTVWNRKTNTYIKVHGPMDGAWLPRCRSQKAVQCAGFWKGADLPSPQENSAYLVAYQKSDTFHCAEQTTPLEKTVRIGNIDDAGLENVTFSVEPSGAESWLTPSLTYTDITITMTLRVDPGLLPGGDNHTATVTVQTASARNTASVKVHADKTMLPRPAGFVVYHANMSDSFAYPELTWEDRADGEAGYIVEFHTNYDLNKTWRALDTVGANAVRYISKLHTCTDETKSGKYRIRAFTTEGMYSPYSVEGLFCVPPDSMVPPDPNWIHEGWVADNSPSLRFDKPVEKLPEGGAPVVTVANGLMMVAIQSTTFRGMVRVVQPNGQLVFNRSIGGTDKKTVRFELSHHTAGVYLVEIVDRRTDRHSVAKQLALLR